MSPFIFLLAALLPLQLFAAKSLEVFLTSPYAILMNAETGAILFEKQAYDAAYPASTTKIATALYLLKTAENHLDDLCICSPESVKMVSESAKRAQKFPSYFLEPQSVNIKLKASETVPLQALLEAALIASANDACNVLAEHVAGDVPTFVAGINRMARSLGCISTHFTNPHGLFNEQHITCAYDMALLTKEALAYPLFRTIVGSTSFERPRTNLQEPTNYRQLNELLHPQSKYYYPKAIGIKTGYTRIAKHNLVAAATDGERTLIAVVHQNPTSSGKYEDVLRLFETAFAEKKMHRLLFKEGETSFQKNLPKATAPLIGELKEDLLISFYPSEEPTIHVELNWSPPPLPITKNCPVGALLILNEKNQQIAAATLYAKDALSKDLRYRLADDIAPLFLKLLPAFALLLALLGFYLRKRKN